MLRILQEGPARKAVSDEGNADSQTKIYTVTKRIKAIYYVMLAISAIGGSGKQSAPAPRRSNVLTKRI